MSYVAGEENTIDAKNADESETLLLSQQICGLAFAGWDTKEICGFAICGLISTNLWINHYKFANLQFTNWHISEIDGFAIAQ